MSLEGSHIHMANGDIPVDSLLTLQKNGVDVVLVPDEAEIEFRVYKDSYSPFEVLCIIRALGKLQPDEIHPCEGPAVRFWWD